MNALQRAKHITSRLGELDEARKYQKEAEALQNKLELLKEQRVALQVAVATAVVLVKNGALDELPATSKMRTDLAKVAEAFNGDTRTLTSGRAFHTLLRSLGNILKTFTERAAEAWNAATSTEPRINHKLLNQIDQIQSQRENVRRLRAAASELASLSKTPPSTQEQWESYVTQRRQVEELVCTLNTDQFPQAVLEFCKKAQGEGATLDMLTPEVKDWLEQNSMYADLRFRLI